MQHKQVDINTCLKLATLVWTYRSLPCQQPWDSGLAPGSIAEGTEAGMDYSSLRDSPQGPGYRSSRPLASPRRGAVAALLRPAPLLRIGLSNPVQGSHPCTLPINEKAPRGAFSIMAERQGWIRPLASPLRGAVAALLRPAPLLRIGLSNPVQGSRPCTLPINEKAPRGAFSFMAERQGFEPYFLSACLYTSISYRLFLPQRDHIPVPAWSQQNAVTWLAAGGKCPTCSDSLRIGGAIGKG